MSSTGVLAASGGLPGLRPTLITRFQASKSAKVFSFVFRVVTALDFLN
jgi:hypothetical protein